MSLPREIGQRIAVLGGTFDPFHNGHLALVETAFAGLELDSLILIPAAVPPHKRDLPVTSLDHRLAMLKLATAGRKGVYVSSLEAERPGPSFSIDTLTSLRRHFGSEVTLFFLLGIDAFVEIQTWKDYQQLPLLADLVVVNRAGTHSLQFEDAVRSMFIGYCPDAQSGCWRGPGGLGVIRSLEMAAVDVSSTAIRKLVSCGQSVAHLLPEAVAEYIESRDFYRS